MERHDENAVIVYTDGSMKSNPRRAGFAFRAFHVDSLSVESVPVDVNPPGFLGATSNQMELMACVEALKLLTGRRSPFSRSSYTKIVIYTDSMYVQDHVYEAEFVWPQRGWLTAKNEPVLSPDLWKELIRLKQKAGRVEFRKVKGHGSNPHNRAVDALARESADLANRRLPGSPLVGRKTSRRKVDPGVVPMKDQTETIKIVVVRPIRGQPHDSYRYEVVDPDSPSFEDVDDAYARSELHLRRAHIYEVQFAEAGSGRWIERIVREVPRDEE